MTVTYHSRISTYSPFRTLILAIALTISPATSYGDDCKEVVVERLALYPMFDFISNNSPGYVPWFIDEFNKQSDVCLKAVPLLAHEAKNSYFAGKYGMLFPDNQYWMADDKEQVGLKVHYSSPIVPYTAGIMVLAENQGKGLKEIRKLVTIQGFTLPPDMAEQVQSGHTALIEVYTAVEAFEQVHLRIADGAYLNIRPGYYFLQFMGIEGEIVFDEDLPLFKGDYHFSSMHEPALIEAINQFIEANGPLLQARREELGILPEL